MRTAFNLLAGFACGFVLASSLPARIPPLTASNVCRTFHPNGAVHCEYTVDSCGQMHGDLKCYWPSGRLRTIVDMNHGQMGRGTLYSDETPEADIEADETL